MPNDKSPLLLDELEASIALHALRLYIKAKGPDVSANTRLLERKLDTFLDGSKHVIALDENLASLLGARGGTKGGASTSEQKRAAAVANGAKGGRPHKPNLFIRFHRSVWEEPDPKLQKKLSVLFGDYSWLPDQQDGQTHGPYLRLYVPEVSSSLERLLSNSMNVIEWDTRPFMRLCSEHKIEPAKAITADEASRNGSCFVCSKSAEWIY